MRTQLCLEQIDVSVEITDILLNTGNRLLLFRDLAVDRQQVVHTLLHIGLVGLEHLLVLLELLLHVGTLLLQVLDVGVRIGFLGPLTLALRLLALGLRLLAFSC